jgi:hypothetical protein
LKQSCGNNKENSFTIYAKEKEKEIQKFQGKTDRKWGVQKVIKLIEKK